MKKLFALALALLMTLSLLAGCGSSGSAAGSSAASGTNAPASTGTGTTASTDGDASPINFNEEPYEVSIQFIGLFEENKNLENVAAALNAITVPKINCKVDIVPLFIGNMNNATSLGVAGDEKLDIVAVGLTNSIDSMVANDLLLPLDALLAERGQDALTVTKTVAEAQKINGATYGITGYAYPARCGGVVYNKTMADQYGIDMHDGMTMEELTAAGAILKEHGVYLTTFPGGGTFNYMFWYGGDYFGNSAAFGGILDPANSTTIVNVFDTKEYRDYYKQMKAWLDAGYMPSDMLTDTTSGQEYFSQQHIFCSSTTYTPNQIASWVNPNFEVGLIQFSDAYISTSGVVEFMLGIAANCKRPDKAMDLLNLIYADAEVANLLQFGIEGTDYAKVEGTESVITFDGTANEDHNSYYTTFSHYGDPMKQKVVAPLTDAYYEELKQFNDNAHVSKNLGYVFDASAFSAEAGAIASILEQKLPIINCGSVADVDAAVDELVAALKRAGIDDVIADNQRQLDEFLANQKS